MRKSVIVGIVVALVAAPLVTGPAHPASAQSSRTSSANAPYRPAPICVTTCSVWRPVDTWSRGAPSILTTTFAPFAERPATVVYAAWIRTASTDLALYLGYKGPGVTGPTLSRGPESVPLVGRPRLLATFNSGFYEKDGAAGFYAHHTLYFPMVKGLATVVRYADGHVDVQTWAHGARPGPTIVMARQNLSLLVDRGRATGLVHDNAAWGLTLHGVAAVWRTALGVDGRGNLVYAAVPNVTAAALADVVVRLHLVRAMQLDINPEWPIFVIYAAAGAAGPSLFVPNPNQIPGRFLSTSTKDFFAVFVTDRPGEAQPW